MTWQPTASMTSLKARTRMMAQIRQFFADRQVWEVETPILARAGVTEPHLQNLTTELRGPGMPEPTRYYLQTSPEYAMKRLLAAGSGSIFQFAKAFRDDEIGRLHNPEFTLLEWYRVGFSDVELMDEIDQLLQLLLATKPANKLSYQQLFIHQLGVDPLTEAGIKQLRAQLTLAGFADIVEQADKDTCLQLAMSHWLEPKLGHDCPCFIYDFPASQAALAKLGATDSRVAKRFELFLNGVELANGYDELTDPVELASRFQQDNQRREQPEAIDQKLLAAMVSGLPACAGVALGFDRLLMLALKLDHIEQALAFPIRNA